MSEIRCIRVDPPAKPSRQEVILGILEQTGGVILHPVSIADKIEMELDRREADNPEPTYRIEMNAEAFDALSSEIEEDGDGLTLTGPGQRLLVHDALMRAVWRCAHPQGDDDGERGATHLDTVRYWRDLYSDAVAVGQEMLDEARTPEGAVTLRGDRLYSDAVKPRCPGNTVTAEELADWWRERREKDGANLLPGAPLIAALTV